MSETEQRAIVPVQIRSDLVDTAISFLKNPKVSAESLEKKRSFLQKKGLTENEIDYAIKIIPQREPNTVVIPQAPQPSFLRRLLSDLILAGLLGYAFKLVQRWFRSRRPQGGNQLTETLKSLQKAVQDMQTSIGKLEQAADQLHLSSMNGASSSSSLEEVKREIQTLKALFLNRSQFPAIPQIPPRLPSWQLEAAERAKARSSALPVATDESNTRTTVEENKEDCDSIVVIPENDKKSDDENRLSTSPSSESANET